MRIYKLIKKRMVSKSPENVPLIWGVEKNRIDQRQLKKIIFQKLCPHFSLWEKATVGCFKRTASKHVYYQGWNRSPAQVGCMRQVLGPGALGRPRGIGWRGWWEGEPGWGIHVNPWLIHVNVWKKPLQCCKVISLQLIKINEKKKLCPHFWVV